jgi:aspartyl-tRNA synthetase
MMATGVENIRDVIPFPRAPGAAEFWVQLTFDDELVIV